jgi:NAD dependent epimerase/dehydratase
MPQPATMITNTWQGTFSEWAMKIQGSKVVITGAGGFIGSHLTEALVRQGARVSVLVHYNSRNDWGMLELLPQEVKQELEVMAGDVRDAALVRSVLTGCDVVFHLASLIAIPYSYRAPASYVETNVQGTLNVMQAALDQKVQKVVHTSTSEVYGTARYTPIDEDHPLQAQSPYAASKIAADKIAESFYLCFGLPVAIIRPFNTFGPRQSARAVIPTIILQALTREVIELGLLTPVRDLTFVHDTVKGFLKIAEVDQAIGKVINIGAGQGITISDLTKTILALMNLEKKIVYGKDRLRPPESEVMILTCNNRKAKEILGWEPATSLEEGIQQTLMFCQNNLRRYKPYLYNV